MSFDEDQLPPPNSGHRPSRPIDENPDAADVAPDAAKFERCPACRKYIFADAEQCPYCKHFVTHEAKRGHPLWMIITAIVLVVLMILFYVLNFPIPMPTLDGVRR